MVVCRVIISSIKKSRTAGYQRRAAPPTTNRSTGAANNNNASRVTAGNRRRVALPITNRSTGATNNNNTNSGTARNQRRAAPPTTIRSTNNNNTNRPSNTISFIPQAHSTPARQPPPQYSSSNTLPSSTNIPLSYPQPPAPFPASGGYISVPTGTALPASITFYPNPGQEPPYQTEVNEGNEEAGQLYQTEPPRYDELFENTTAW